MNTSVNSLSEILYLLISPSDRHHHRNSPTTCNQLLSDIHGVTSLCLCP